MKTKHPIFDPQTTAADPPIVQVGKRRLREVSNLPKVVFRKWNTQWSRSGLPGPKADALFAMLSVQCSGSQAIRPNLPF